MMNFQKNPDAWLILFFAVVCALMLWSSSGLSGIAGQVPQVIIGIVLMLLVIQLVLLRNQELEEPARQNLSEQAQEQKGVIAPLKAERFLPSLLWLALLPICTWVLGLILGPALFCAVFLRWHGREGWLICAGYSASLALMVAVTFLFVLGTSPYPGLLGNLMY